MPINFKWDIEANPPAIAFPDVMPISQFGIQQALAGKIVSGPEDRQAIARILNRLLKSPGAQLALRHSSSTSESRR